MSRSPFLGMDPFGRVYTAGGHDDNDYSKPPIPPLDADDAAWAQELLKGYVPQR